VRTVSRQSLVLCRAVKSGEMVQSDDLTVQQAPGTGIPAAAMIVGTIGRRAARTLPAGTLLQWVHAERRRRKSSVAMGASPMREEEAWARRPCHDMSIRVCFVTGTRAEFGLMRSTLRAIAAHPKLQLQIIATGMHLDRRHGDGLKEIRRARLEDRRDRARGRAPVPRARQVLERRSRKSRRESRS
jgi:hypothetical protein